MAGVPQARLQRLGAGAAAGVMVGAAVAAVAYVRPAFLERAEQASYDVRTQAVASSEKSSEIVFIDVSEDDIINVERNWGVTWPWPRAMWGYMAPSVVGAGARAIVYDWLFQDRGIYSIDDAEEFAEALREAGKSVIGLALLRQSVRRARANGRWGVRVTEVPSRKDAQARALRLLSWDAQPYLVGDGPTTIYIGGLESADAVSQMWDRVSTRSELSQDLGLPDEGEPPPPPEPIELSATVLEGRFGARDLISRRDGFLPSELGGEFPDHSDMYEPLAVIGAAPTRMGLINQARAEDGVMRRHAPFGQFEGRSYPSLAVATFLVGNPEIEPRVDGSELVLGERRVKLDENGRFIIDFDARGRYTHVSAYEVLRSIALVDEGKPPSIPADTFKDKYVIVSAAGLGLRDSHPSPVARNHPGAEIQANALENLLVGSSIHRSSRVVDALVSFVCGFISAITVMLVWGGVRRVQLALVMTFAIGVGLGLLWWQISVWFLGSRCLWIGAVAPLVSIGASAFAAILTTSASERRSKRFVLEALGRYTSPALVAELTEHPEHLSLEWGDTREMSVYFSDIAGFTSISEGLEPKRLVALLNEYLTSMTDIILAHDGVVDKYIGDAIMAFWGAPIPDDEHAVKAVRCALAMRKKCDELRPRWQERFGEHVFARAGVNSGEAVVGNMGSAHKYNYTVMGDMVNLASRLEGANKPYASELMISEFTLARLGGEFAVRELDRLAVKGKEEPVTVFEVLDVKEALDETRQELVTMFAKGLTLYKKREFSAAFERFTQALEIDPADGPSKLYAERCTHFSANPPPPDWDGVWRMTTK